MFWKNLWNHSLKYSPLLGRDFRNSQNYVTLHRNWNFFIYVIHRETKMKTSFYQEERYLEPFSSTSNTYCMPAEIVPGSWTAPPLRFFFRKQKDISLRKILLLNQDFETREISPLAFSQLSFPNAPVPAAGGSRGPAATATGLLSTRPRPGREGPDKPRDTHPAVLAVYLHDTSPGVAASPPVLTWGPSRRGPGPAALHTGSLPPLRHGGAAAAAPARRRSPPRAFRSRSRSAPVPVPPRTAETCLPGRARLSSRGAGCGPRAWGGPSRHAGAREQLEGKVSCQNAAILSQRGCF